MSELASESVLQRQREAPTKRGEECVSVAAGSDPGRRARLIWKGLSG